MNPICPKSVGSSLAPSRPWHRVDSLSSRNSLTLNQTMVMLNAERVTSISPDFCAVKYFIQQLLTVLRELYKIQINISSKLRLSSKYC